MKPPKPSTPDAAKKLNIEGDKKPLDPREDPLARDARGKATREDVRRVASPTNAPRASRRAS